LRSESEIRAFHLENQIRHAERTLRYVVINVSDEMPIDRVVDPGDWHLVHIAQRATAGVLLSLDQRHLPHGLAVGGVQCWHPNTFLTLLFQQNPELYQNAVQLVRDYPSARGRGLLSR
jgi:predicted nucleic acid-binding protein